MTDKPNYYAAPDAQLEPESEVERDAHASRDAPTTFGGTLSGSIELYKKAFVPLIGISFTWGVIDAVTDIAYEWSFQDFMMGGEPVHAVIAGVALLMTFVGSVFFWAIGLRRVHHIDHSGSAGGEWSISVERFFPLAAYFLLMGLVIGGVTLAAMAILVLPAFLAGLPGVMLFLLGLICFIPGLIVLFLLFVGDVHVVAARSGPIEALRKSYELVKGVENWLFTFGIVVVMGLVVFLPVFILAFCVAGATFVATESMKAMDVVVAGITPFINIVTFPFVLSINYMLYQALLARKNFYYTAMIESADDSYSQPQYGSAAGSPGGQPAGPSGPTDSPAAGPGIRPDGPSTSQQEPPSGGRQGSPSEAGDEDWSSTPEQSVWDPGGTSGEDGNVAGDDDDDSSVW